MLRQRGTTDSDALSKLILGIVEVKGKWQLPLTGNDSLLDALQDPKEANMAVKTIQQVGMAFSHLVQRSLHTWVCGCAFKALHCMCGGLFYIVFSRCV